MFSYTCFLRTPENWVVEMLQKIGYCEKRAQRPGDVWLMSYCDRNNEAWYKWIPRSFDEKKRGYDCGDNGELFLSLAAFNTENDKYQIFFSDVESQWVNQGMYAPIGSPHFCLIDRYRPLDVDEAHWNTFYATHKGNKSELVEYYARNPKSCFYHRYIDEEFAKSDTISKINEVLKHIGDSSIKVSVYVSQHIFDKFKEYAKNKEHNLRLESYDLMHYFSKESRENVEIIASPILQGMEMRALRGNNVVMTCDENGNSKIFEYNDNGREETTRQDKE